MKCVHFSRAKIVLAGSEHITFWGTCHPRPSKTQSQTEIKRRAWHRLWMKCRYHSSHAVEYGTRGRETGYNRNLIAMQVPCNSRNAEQWVKVSGDGLSRTQPPKIYSTLGACAKAWPIFLLLPILVRTNY